MLPFTHFIFDFDGVVADTENVFSSFDCTLLNEVLQKAGIEPSLTSEDVRKMAGNDDIGKLTIIGTKFNFDVEPYKDDFIEKRTILRKTLFRDHPAPLGENLHAFLKQLNGRYALATNKTAQKLFHDLELMELDKLFETIVTCDPPLQKKPAPDLLLEATRRLNASPETCAYIGDNTIDMIAAKNAGMFPIGFIIEGLDGHQARAQSLKEAGAKIIIDDFNTLIPYVIKP